MSATAPTLPVPTAKDKAASISEFVQDLYKKNTENNTQLYPILPAPPLLSAAGPTAHSEEDEHDAGGTKKSKKGNFRHQPAGTLSVAQKRTPLYLFVKLVAGHLGENNLSPFFDLEAIHTQKNDTLYLSCLSNTLISCIAQADTVVKQLSDGTCDLTQDVITDTDHPLYEPTARYVSAVYLRNTSRRVSNLTSTKYRLQIKQDTNLYTQMFIEEVRRYLNT